MSRLPSTVCTVPQLSFQIFYQFRIKKGSIIADDVKYEGVCDIKAGVLKYVKS